LQGIKKKAVRGVRPESGNRELENRPPRPAAGFEDIRKRWGGRGRLSSREKLSRKTTWEDLK